MNDVNASAVPASSPVPAPFAPPLPRKDDTARTSEDIVSDFEKRFPSAFIS